MDDSTSRKINTTVIGLLWLVTDSLVIIVFNRPEMMLVVSFLLAGWILVLLLIMFFNPKNFGIETRVITVFSIITLSLINDSIVWILVLLTPLVILACYMFPIVTPDGPEDQVEVGDLSLSIVESVSGIQNRSNDSATSGSTRKPSLTIDVNDYRSPQSQIYILHD